MSTLKTADSIAQEIAARCARITIANGSRTDIGTRVFRGRRRIDDSHVPCVIIAEGLDQVTPARGAIPSVAIVQTYMLIGYSECHPDHPNDAGHEIIKDLKQSMFSDGVKFGGKVLQVEYKNRDIGPRGDGVAIVCASIEITVQFVEDLQNP
jgi:hypothetical protein